MDEVWKAIPGWEGVYEVSSLVRIRRIKWGNRWRLLKPFLNSYGYLKVNLSGKDGRRESRQIGYFYLLAFVGPCPPGKECCHHDDNRFSTDPANFYWGTHHQNMLNKVRNGNSVRGQKNGSVKITEAAARAILAAPRGYVRRAAKKFGISPQHASRIRSGGSWAHLVKP
jgi:NUMOD4 motif